MSDQLLKYYYQKLNSKIFRTKQDYIPYDSILWVSTDDVSSDPSIRIHLKGGTSTSIHFPWESRNKYPTIRNDVLKQIIADAWPDDTPGDLLNMARDNS